MSPRVTLSEIDLSARVPGFPGVYGAIVIDAKKGPVDDAVLVGSETELLRIFTPEERIETGYSLGYFSALAFLERSNKLWVRRAVSADAVVGGSVIRSGSGQANASWTVGLTDPTSYAWGTYDHFSLYAKDPGAWATKIGVRVLTSRAKASLTLSSLLATTSVTIVKSALTGGTTFADSSAVATGDPVVINSSVGSQFVVPNQKVNMTTGVFTNTIASVATGVPLKVEFDGVSAKIVSGNVYYAINASGTTFKLAASSADAAGGTAITFTGEAFTNIRFTPVCLVPPELAVNKTYYFVKVDGSNSGLARTYAEALAGVKITFSAFGSGATFQRLNCLSNVDYATGEGLIFDGYLLPVGIDAGKTYYASVINTRVFLAASYSDAVAFKNLISVSLFLDPVITADVTAASSTLMINGALATGANLTVAGNYPRPLAAATYAVVRVADGTYRLSPTTSDALLGSYITLSSAFSESVATGNWNAGTGVITVTQNYATGTPVKLVGTPGAGLVVGETYYVINLSATTIKLAANAVDAAASTPLAFVAPVAAVTISEQFNFTVTGAGTMSVSSPIVIRDANAFRVQVVRMANKNVAVEDFTVSLDPNQKDGFGRSMYLMDVIQASNYLRAAVNPAAVITNVPVPALDPIVLGGGNDGSPVTDGRMILAADSFSNENARQITVIMDGGWATPAFHTKLIAVAQARRCVFFGSTPYAQEASSTYLTDLVDYRSNVLNANTSHAALYSPHVKIYDKYNDRSIYAAPDGYAAAALSATALNYELWFPVGGFKRGMLNVNDVRRRFSRAEMDYLYDNGINPIRFYPGKGISIWGQKTLLAQPSALQDLNVRCLLVVLEPAIEVALDGFLFEFNDEATRSIVEGLLNSYLEGVKARQGVTSFRVQCNSENNLSTDIDNGRLIVWIFLKPNRAVSEVRVPIAITSQGLSFDTAAQSL